MKVCECKYAGVVFLADVVSSHEEGEECEEDQALKCEERVRALRAKPFNHSFERRDSASHEPSAEQQSASATTRGDARTSVFSSIPIWLFLFKDFARSSDPVGMVLSKGSIGDHTGD